MKKLVVAVLALLVGAACSTAPCACSAPPVSPSPPELADAARPKASTCGSACVHMRDLHCELGNVTPRGATCEKVCENTHANNAGVGFNVDCLTSAATCGAADACR